MKKELLGMGGVVAMGTEWRLNITMILVELDGWIQRGNKPTMIFNCPTLPKIDQSFRKSSF